MFKMHFSIKSKFIILFSILMGIVLLLQFYLMDRAQNEVLAELQRISHSINKTTNLIFTDESLLTVGTKNSFPSSKPQFLPGNANFKEIMDHVNDSLHIIFDTRRVGDDTFDDEFEAGYFFSINNDSNRINGSKRTEKTWFSNGSANIKKSRVTWSFNQDSSHKYITTVDIDLNEISEFSADTTLNIVQRIVKRPRVQKDPFTVLVPNFSASGAPLLYRYRYDTGEIHSALGDIRNRNLLITLILFAFSVVAIFFIARSFEKPIHDLRDAFSDVVNGNLDVHVKTKSQDEIAELAGSFNIMVGELKKNREKEKLLNRKERFAALGQLAAGVAHEIKNPLNAINLTIGHLRDKYADSKDKKVNQYIDSIGTEIMRLDKTTNDFLNYVRSESLNIEMTDLNSLLDEVCGLYEREFDFNKIDVVKEYGSILKMGVDRERMKTVFGNILLNAIQAMPRGGTLTLTTDSARNTIVFSDTGKGIPPKDLEHIFDLFYTTKAAGTGLGLPTAYKIVKAHGGELSARNAPAKGTILTIQMTPEKKD